MFRLQQACNHNHSRSHICNATNYPLQLAKSATEDGVAGHYMVSESEPTGMHVCTCLWWLLLCNSADASPFWFRFGCSIVPGTCAVLVNETERSLIANLAAANAYKISHLEQESIQVHRSCCQTLWRMSFLTPTHTTLSRRLCLPPRSSTPQASS